MRRGGVPPEAMLGGAPGARRPPRPGRHPPCLQAALAARPAFKGAGVPRGSLTITTWTVVGLRLGGNRAADTPRGAAAPEAAAADSAAQPGSFCFCAIAVPAGSAGAGSANRCGPRMRWRDRKSNRLIDIVGCGGCKRA